MNKKNASTKVFIYSELELKKLGENIKLARERRKMTASELAIKASVSRMALMRIEKGDETVGVGKIFNVLSALGLLKGLADIADPNLDRAQAINEIINLREGISKNNIKKNIYISSKKLVKRNLDF